MFVDCTSLNSIKLGYTGTAASAPTNVWDRWASGVASTGTFYYNGDDTAANFGLSGWTKTPF
jgi:hypothetical protein